MVKKTSRAWKETTAAEQRAEDAARPRKIYGALLPDVQLLQSRGFVITKERGQLMIGGRETTAEDLQAKAARERRLLGAAPTAARRVTTTAGGLKVGDTVVKPVRAVSEAAQRTLSQVKTKAIPRSRATPGKAHRAEGPAFSADLGKRPKVVWLDLALLGVDKRYQREIGRAGVTHVNRIASAFNWNCYQPIVVSERGDGSYAVIDGQHRLEAARKHPLVDELPCYVIDAPGVAAQAAVFVAVNSRRLGLTSLQTFFAAVAAGDALALEAALVARAAGVTLLRSPPSYDIPARSILSPGTLQKMLRRVGRPAVQAALKMLAAAHPTTLNAFRSPTIAALCVLAADKSIDQARLQQVLAGLDLGKLYDDARNARVIFKGTIETATERVLRGHYDPTTLKAAA